MILESDMDHVHKTKQINNLRYKGVQIEDLSLTFVLPGYDIELKANGKNTFVNLDNL